MELHGATWSGAVCTVAAWPSNEFASQFAFRTFLPPPIKAAVQMISVFLFVTVVWLAFILPDFSHVIEFLKSLVHNRYLGSELGVIARVLLYSLPVVIYHLNYLADNAWPGRQSRAYCEPVAYGVMLFLLITNSGSSTEFIYFQF